MGDEGFDPVLKLKEENKDQKCKIKVLTLFLVISLFLNALAFVKWNMEKLDSNEITLGQAVIIEERQ